MAVKEAAKASPLDTNDAIRNFYFHRLLCRVFSERNSPFVLKGGLGILARTIDARSTRDVDLATDELEVDEAVRELERLASKDMDDFVRFTLRDVRPIKVEDDYRDGYTVSFDVHLGAKAMQPISVDLVADQIAIGEPELLVPVDRIYVDGLPTCAYPVYPAEKSVVDKVCGIVERHRGLASSRVKDLVDIVIYALTVDLDSGGLAEVLRRELALRAMRVDGGFVLPTDWGVVPAYARQYEKLAAIANLPDDLRSMEGGFALAKALIDPVYGGTLRDATWDHDRLEWLATPTPEQHKASEFMVAPYSREHADEMRAVCLAQASERARSDEAHGRFTLLMYCDAYLERGVAYMLLDEGGVARGYVLAAEDARTWRSDFEPYRQQIAGLGADYERRVAEELDFYESVAGEYPAHLHIDIAEECTGQGGGRMLMEALLARLRADGVRGVVFGVAAANERAVGFYEHMGFERLGEYSDGEGLTFCMRLA
jgi:ribosomal protein S18 acetylase RimI-like enzyme